MEAHDKKCGSCAGQLSVVGVVLLHARTRQEVWAASQDSQSVRRTLKWTKKESRNQLEVLNRFISVNDSGYTSEPDVRHSTMIVEELWLQGAKTLNTPVSGQKHPKSKGEK